MSASQPGPRIAPAVRLYLRLAFGLTWGVGLLMLLLPQSGVGGSIRQVLWFLSVSGPSIAGFAAARSLGRLAFADYTRRVFSLRAAWPWVLAAPALLVAFHAAAGLGAGASFVWPGLAALAAGLLATSVVDPGPLEEFGWRGFLQPMLQNRFGPIAASAIVGVVWGLWHLPVLVLPGFPQHDTSLPLAIVILRFIAQTTALSIVIGFFLNRARGAVIVAMACHWAANQGASGHVWPFDATAWTLVLIAAAVLLVVLQRVGLLRSEPSVRQVFAAAPPAATDR